ncbi:hypothetical protein ACJJTC_015029 [Scirpophaga incertulas]
MQTAYQLSQLYTPLDSELSVWRWPNIILVKRLDETRNYVRYIPHGQLAHPETPANTPRFPKLRSCRNFNSVARLRRVRRQNTQNSNALANTVWTNPCDRIKQENSKKDRYEWSLMATHRIRRLLTPEFLRVLSFQRLFLHIDNPLIPGTLRYADDSTVAIRYLSSGKAKSEEIL